jgi:hypothetical protein
VAIKELLAGMASKVAAKLGNGDTPARAGEQDGNAPSQDLTEAQREYGPNFEQLKKKKPHIVAALQQLTLEYRAEGQYAQRHRILRTRYARLFWQGIQYAMYNSGTGDFDFASAALGLQAGGSFRNDPAGQRFEYVTNLFQAYGLSFIALVSQDIPSWICYPKSREVQEDITAAKVGYDVGDLIERNNNPYKALETISRYLWTDGMCGQYWRYVVDGERFGYNEMPVQTTRDVMLEGERMTVPNEDGTEKIPNGQEVVTYVGGLELIVPIYADSFHECPYIQWNCEPHRAKLKATYPHAAKGIETDAGMTADQVYERISRLGVKQNISFALPGDALEMLPTFSRTWLRKWAFRRFQDEKLVGELEELFPDGCYMAFAGLEYCESRNESMDDHWKILHGIPGDGQSRPAVGDVLIDVQERYNTLANLQMETIEYGIPPIYADPAVLNFDALASQDAEPAVHYPARAKPGMALADGFYSPDPAKMDASLPALMQELIGPVAQFLTGLFNAAAGGPMEGVAGKTAAGYTIARDQALGRVGMIYRRIKEFYAEGIGLGLEIFKKNRPEDVEVPFPGENDEEKAKWIRLADFKGNIMVEAEADESFPRLKSQQRAVIEALIQNAAALPPELLALFDNPKNMTFIKNVMGLSELELPGENAEILAMRLIQRLLETGPIQGPPQPTPQTNPETGQTVFVMVPPPPQATIQVDPLLALNAEFIGLMLQEFIDWAGEDAGQDEARNNPKGYMNVYLFAKQLSGIVQQAAQAAQPKIPPKPPSMSVQIDKLPPNEMAQALAMDGIQADPAELQANKDQQRQDKANELQAKQAKLANKKPAGEIANG